MILDKKQFARIDRQLAMRPDGMTTGEIIDKLELPTSIKALSARMGKMFFYGRFDRSIVRHSTGGGHVTRWKTKAPLLDDRTAVPASKPLS